MTTVKIDLQGADSASRAALRRTESRLIRFPDGIERIVTLTRWHWQALETLVERQCLWHCDVPRASYDNAAEFHEALGLPFEEYLHVAFARFIEFAMKAENEEARGAANENIY